MNLQGRITRFTQVFNVGAALNQGINQVSYRPFMRPAIASEDSPTALCYQKGKSKTHHRPCLSSLPQIVNRLVMTLLATG
jgi:hypothetical protein